MIQGDPVEVHHKEKKINPRLRPSSAHKKSKSQAGFNIKLQSLDSKGNGIAFTPVTDEWLSPFINVTTREKEILKSIIKPDSPQEKVKQVSFHRQIISEYSPTMQMTDREDYQLKEKGFFKPKNQSISTLLFKRKSSQ